MSGMMAGLSVALVLASSAPPLFPPSLSLKEDRTTLSFAFAGVASVAMVREATGRSYLDYLGEDAPRTGVPPGDHPLCTPEGLARFARDRRDFCKVAGGSIDLGDCRWRVWCASVKVTPELARDPRWGPVIENALNNPCAALTPPDQLSRADLRLRARGLGLAAGEMWGLMKCNRSRPRKVVGVTYSAEHSAYFVRYR